MDASREVVDAKGPRGSPAKARLCSERPNDRATLRPRPYDMILIGEYDYYVEAYYSISLSIVA